MNKTVHFFGVFLFLISVSGSCQSIKKNSFNEFKTKYDFLNDSGWIVDYGAEDNGSIDAKAHKILGDTLFQVILRKTYDLQGSIVMTIKPSKIFQVGEVSHIISLDENLKPKYSYKIDDSGQKTFLYGKYLYLSESNKLDAGQQRYFSLHKDSLRMVQGNELSPLPRLKN